MKIRIHRYAFTSEARRKEGNMVPISPQVAYKNLQLLDRVDAATSALYRQWAQDVLADSTVSFKVRQAIADRLNHANHLLELQTVVGDDSY